VDGERDAVLWEANAETWTQHARAGYDVYRDAVNTPQFLALLPPVNGLDGLDIGCGEGSNTRALARLGARMHAIDVAPTFVKHAADAERAEPLGITYHVAGATALPFAGERFAFATAFMVLMDVLDYRAALAEAQRVLRPGGFLQFSILHPCFMPPERRVLRDAAGTARSIQIGRYFDNVDGEVERWAFTAVPEAERATVEPFAVPRYHRVLSDWINAVIDAGFAVERLGEPAADEATAERLPFVADSRIAPLFLHVRARKAR
jgi:SAM-dependent methyltransferase